MNDILAYLREHCIVKDYKELDKKVCRDADDDRILALAKHTHTDYIITGDEDLLVLKDLDSIPIVNPRNFWNIIKGKEVIDD
ncbi:MAG: putative toxin-antitoxin system toxin component, PIN family [Actinobacteria bacterium]|nr:putative toxin-antitoxin system toxin component, PIN family [Actinomycetota bacterium]